MTMNQPQRDTKTLGWMIAFAVTVNGLFRCLPRLTGITELDGLLAVLLGLYICSQPAANALNMLLYGAGIRNWASLNRSDVMWLGLNFLVLLSGLTLIAAGTMRFFSRAL